MHGKKDLCLVWNGLAYGAALAVAVGLKYHYSTSGADQLRWMLEPLARLVGIWTGIRFGWEPPAGYMGTSAGIVIAPACAGINFLVICFSALFFTLAHRLKGVFARLAWLPASLLAAYAVTLFANTTRIITSIYLYRADIYGAWITPGRVHRLNGVLIYACFLLIAYLAAERFTAKAPREPRRTISSARLLSVPFLWYILITIFVPFFGGGSLRGEELFLEHAAVVMAAVICLFILSLSAAVLYHKKVDRSPNGSENNRSRSSQGTKTRSEPQGESARQ